MNRIGRIAKVSGFERRHVRPGGNQAEFILHILFILSSYRWSRRQFHHPNEKGFFDRMNRIERILRFLDIGEGMYGTDWNDAESILHILFILSCTLDRGLCACDECS